MLCYVADIRCQEKGKVGIKCVILLPRESVGREVIQECNEYVVLVACSAGGWREGLVSSATLPHCHNPDELNMFSHLNVGPGAACTGQVRLCSERTETVTAGSTLLEALGRLGPIGSKILTLKDGL